MKILQVIPTYLPATRHGGPVRAVHGLSKALVERGHAVDVATTQLEGSGVLDVPTDRPVELDGVSVHYFPVHRPRRVGRSPAMARWFSVEIGRFDLVHLHSIFLWPTSSAARAAERARRPWLISPRGMLVRDLFRRRGGLRKRLWLAVVERRTLEGAKRLIATSELERSAAAEFGLRLPPIEILPNGVDLAELDSRSGGLDAETEAYFAAAPTFLFLGRLSWKKRLDRLVHAMRDVPAAQLLIAGNDEERIGPGIDDLAQSLGVRARVRRIGFVDGSRKAVLLHRARALVLASLSENFANVVLEAWACGTPVIVSEGVGLAPEVRANDAGRVVGESPPDLAIAMSELAAQPEAARRMGERGRQLARSRYSWDVVAARAEEIYREVLAEVGQESR